MNWSTTWPKSIAVAASFYNKNEVFFTDENESMTSFFRAKYYENLDATIIDIVDFNGKVIYGWIDTISMKNGKLCNYKGTELE